MTDRFLTTEQLLERLISFRTVSDQSNRELTDFVCAYLSQLGIAFETSTDATGGKVAILATIGPMKDGGIVLSGHTDVVPVSGQSWSSDPFSLRRDGDRLIGRGSVDMKGFCATALAMLPALRDVFLARPLHLLLSYDEETTGLGSLQLIERFGRDFPQPSGAIIGEPTEMKVAIAHKGIVSYQTKINGVAAHASRPDDGVNAIALVNEAISFLSATADELRATPNCDPRFDPSHTTVHVGVVNGGSATNIVPSECTFGWEVRNVPAVDIDLVHEKFQTWTNNLLAERYESRKDVAIATGTMCKLPALATDAEQDVVRSALQASKQNAPCTVPFATEAGHFQRSGIPSVVCGPGSIAQAHRPDEYISVTEIRRYESFLFEFCRTLTG